MWPAGRFSPVSGPPEDVLTAILEGGALDGIEFEIEPGQVTMERLLTFGHPLSELLARRGYRYAGRVDGEGRAVFIEAEG